MDIKSPVFVLILLAEFCGILSIVAIALFVQTRRLKKAQQRSRLKIRELKQLVERQSSMDKTPIDRDGKTSYPELLEDQLEKTRSYHESLGGGIDIALDLDPGAPADRRTAALRHAFLIAEREATADATCINWPGLSNRFQLLLDFTSDYSNSTTGDTDSPMSDMDGDSLHH